MHPVPSSRLAYTLASRSESSFPERHAWSEPDDMSHLESESHEDVTYSQPGFPKIDIFAPGLSSFWQQNWLDHSQPLLHHQRHPHQDRVTPPQAHHSQPHQVHHEFFTPSPISPVQPSDASAQAEWEILRATTTTAGHHAPPPGQHFPWLPSQATMTSSDPKIKVEDDSDSNWSLNESLEEIHLPPLIQPNVQRLRRGSTGRVSKVGRAPVTKSSGAMYQTFRVGRPRHPGGTNTSSTTERVEINLCGTPYDTTAGGTTEDLSPDDYAVKVQERRIAHKLSEKSRRNRLTAAIREIQKLMPADVENKDKDEGEKEEAVVQAQSISKVDVVEMAVGFVRRLKRENERLAARVKVAEEKLREKEEKKEKEMTRKET
ncbi:hypothetical protein B0T14DRAFT_563334 [Immersiella caudata]|uniref:BHLH domain-containing protein n=1 Tax=Immersiella caudata TaxID=314043 RepID=A0AA39X576_9PEZI|nr:hypothetical protein B0T14DRAFT_563334 [Immersiella caudata]